jgi:hypothetical protein
METYDAEVRQTGRRELCVWIVQLTTRKLRYRMGEEQVTDAGGSELRDESTCGQMKPTRGRILMVVEEEEMVGMDVPLSRWKGGDKRRRERDGRERGDRFTSAVRSGFCPIVKGRWTTRNWASVD